MDINKLKQQAKDALDKRGGTHALKEDLAELKDVAQGEGTLKEKAKAAADAVKEPGAAAPPASAEELPPRG